MSEGSDWSMLAEAAEGAPAARLRFEAGNDVIEHGLHVTEMRRARVDAIDCGLGRHSWEEAQLELLQGGAAVLTGAALARLLRRGAAALGLAHGVPLSVEAAPGGGGLRRFRIAAVEAGPRIIRVALEATRAACRPREAGCCGPAAPACCG